MKNQQETTTTTNQHPKVSGVPVQPEPPQSWQPVIPMAHPHPQMVQQYPAQMVHPQMVQPQIIVVQQQEHPFLSDIFNRVGEDKQLMLRSDVCQDVLNANLSEDFCDNEIPSLGSRVGYTVAGGVLLAGSVAMMVVGSLEGGKDIANKDAWFWKLIFPGFGVMIFGFFLCGLGCTLIDEKKRLLQMKAMIQEIKQRWFRAYPELLANKGPIEGLDFSAKRDVTVEKYGQTQVTTTTFEMSARFEPSLQWQQAYPDLFLQMGGCGSKNTM